MTAPFEIMMSLTMPAVSNARVSGDGGINIGQASLGALLTSLVGVAWSKDNIRTTHDQSMPFLQMLMSTLSLGPVGIADALSAMPTDPSARITSNVSLVMMAISQNGKSS